MNIIKDENNAVKYNQHSQKLKYRLLPSIINGEGGVVRPWETKHHSSTQHLKQGAVEQNKSNKIF